MKLDEDKPAVISWESDSQCGKPLAGSSDGKLQILVLDTYVSWPKANVIAQKWLFL